MRPTSRQLQNYKKTGKWIAPEGKVLDQVCKYLKIQYPTCLFKVDYGAGAILTGQQAGQQKRMQKVRGWPDLFIAEPRHGWAGLFIELKKDGETIYNAKGLFKSDHLKIQSEVHAMLRARGFQCDFAKGFDEAKALIDDYLSR